MKSIKVILAVVAVLLGAATAQAGDIFKIGPRVGLTVNEMKFNKSTFDDSNRCGWTGGLMTEFRVPVIGIGADLSFMYVRRNSEVVKDRDYFEIPLNLRYNLSLPALGSIFTPYLAVGPSVSFLTSKKNIENAYHNKAVDWALNFGLGFQLFKHLDISARYGLGLTKAFRTFGVVDGQPAGIDGKNRYWTISAAYLF